MAEFIFINVIQ